MTEPSTVTGARRELGVQLAGLRGAAGHRQAGLAALIGYSRSTVANVEAGRQQAGRSFWEQCDKALSTGGVLAVGHDQVEGLVRQRHRETADEARRTREAQIQQWKQAAGLTSMPLAVQGIPDARTEREAVAAVIHRTFSSAADDASDSDGRSGADALERRVLAAYQQTRQAGDPLSVTLVGGFAGSGKSEFARFLSAVTGWTILDKDTLTRPLVEQLLLAHGSDINDRESQTYLEKVRPFEYRCLIEASLENLKAGVSTVLTAPFLKEFRDEAWLTRVKNRCATYGANFTVIWVKCDPESMFDYISYRGAARDAWKVNHWDDYLANMDASYEPSFPHHTIDNRLNAAVALADQARDFASRVQS